MRRTRMIAIALVWSIRTIAAALDVGEDTYGSISDYLMEVYGIDSNQGLTALPVLDIPLGGRAEGMAGAFSAVADDASFLEWNPAGSSMLARTELALFHNNWIADTNIEGIVYTTRFGNLGLSAGGKWLYLPFTEYNEFGDRASKGHYSELVAILNGSYNFFSGYYFSGISVGINLKGAFRFVPDYSDDAGNLIAGSGAAQSTFAPVMDLGILTRFNLFKFYHARERNASLALVGRNIGPPTLGEPLPTAAVTALSYRPIRPVLFSFDLSFPINLQNPNLSEHPFWAAGSSVDVTNFLSMRAGLQAKRGNVRITMGSAVVLNFVVLDVNYTLDLLTQFQPLSRVSVAARFNFGDRGRREMAARVEGHYLRGLEAYAGGDNEVALREWEAALRLDPRFDPAREGRAAILDTMTLEERIGEIQRLE